MLVLTFSETFLTWDSGTRKQLRCLRWHFLSTKELLLNVPARAGLQVPGVFLSEPCRNLHLLHSAAAFNCQACRLLVREGEAAGVPNERPVSRSVLVLRGLLPAGMLSQVWCTA